MSEPAVKGIRVSRIHRKQALETPSDEQTSVGVHVGPPLCLFRSEQDFDLQKNRQHRLITQKNEATAILRTITVNRRPSNFLNL